MRHEIHVWLRAVVALVMALVSTWAVPAQAQVQASAPAVADEYSERIKPILEGRCIACHSCNNAPCQLNLQNHAGAARGATTRNAYDRFRPRSVPPSRLDIDATSTADWRAKGFFDVLGATASTGARSTGPQGDPGRSLLLRAVQLRAAHPAPQPVKPVNESQTCPADASDPRIDAAPGQFGMPYGLPALAPAEIDALRSWIANGAPGPGGVGGASRPSSEIAALPAASAAEARAWEAYLNGPSPRQKLVGRYLYEHLFLAHLHFPSAQTGATRPDFFRLVRSRTACERGVDEIATRRPTDDPGGPDVSYCLRRVTASIVDKTHIPYALTPEKLARITSTFGATDWTVATPPGHGDEQAKNPFATFAAIPVEARYRFLLDDAHYQIATFIKGPVCNGGTAVNSIQEQFFVFFLKPEADSMVASPAHAARAKHLLILPGAWGSDVPLADGAPFIEQLVAHRERYRKLRAEHARTLRPDGYGLADIWDGDGTNPNAVLTVFRHFDNAAVVQGAAGDLSKTVFVLDYPLLERLVYNLVVNFDVFGNVGHQSLTRLYMDMIRMEAEELFLAFLPPSQRAPLRRAWYRGGVLTDIKLKYVFPLVDQRQPTAVSYANPSNAKAELVQRLLAERLPAPARGPVDALNWKSLRAPGQDASVALSGPQQALRRLTSIKAASATPFARYFPDLANILMRRADGRTEVYSIIRNREHQNVSWIAGESLRLATWEDTLTIREGYLGAYPNMVFVLNEAEVDAFSRAAARIKSPADYAALVDRHGIRRTSDTFWPVMDELNAHFQRTEPVDFGTLDLTRYELAGP